MGDTKKQHFVPQSYLKRFSKNGKQIQVFDKVLKNSFSAGIRDVAQESHFYTIPDEIISSDAKFSKIDRLIFEKAFIAYESELNLLIKVLITLPPGISIPRRVRESFSILVAIQLLRTKKHRNLIKEATEKFYEAIFQELVKVNFGEEATKYTPKAAIKEKYEGMIHSQYIFDFDNLAEMAEIFYNHIWMVGINNSESPFYTSDNPVVMHTPFKNKIRGVGIKSKGIEIAYPLSSQYILILADRDSYKDYEAFDGKSSNMREENVEYYNSLQVIHSNRQIYCEEQDFYLVKDMIKESPDISNPKSNRVSVNILDKY